VIIGTHRELWDSVNNVSIEVYIKLSLQTNIAYYTTETADTWHRMPST